jgi:hypothetical protein
MLVLMMLIITMPVRVSLSHVGVPMRMLRFSAGVRMHVMIIVRVLMGMRHRLMSMRMLVIRHLSTSPYMMTLPEVDYPTCCA